MPLSASLLKLSVITCKLVKGNIEIVCNLHCQIKRRVFSPAFKIANKAVRFECQRIRKLAHRESMFLAQGA